MMLDLELGRRNVFWYGRDSNSDFFNRSEVEDFSLIGGHRTFSFYSDPGFAYLAIVREPFGRVISLYNYLRTVELSNWKRRGLDPDSFTRTLQNSDAFVELIRNGQCRYLSGAPEFDGTIDHISSHKYLIGSLDQIADFITYIGKRLNWGNFSALKRNVTPSGYRHKVHIGWRARRRLRNLLDADLRLYRHIADGYGGLIAGIEENDWEEFRSLLEKPYREIPLLLLLETIDITEDTVLAGIVLKNIGRESFPAHGEYYAGVKALRAGGEILRESRTRILSGLCDSGAEYFSLSIENIPREEIKALEFGVFDARENRWLGVNELATVTMTGI